MIDASRDSKPGEQYQVAPSSIEPDALTIRNFRHANLPFDHVQKYTVRQQRELSHSQQRYGLIPLITCAAATADRGLNEDTATIRTEPS